MTDVHQYCKTLITVGTGCRLYRISLFYSAIFLLGSKLLWDFSDGVVDKNPSANAADMVFPVVMYGCESWTVKKAEHRRIDAFELWC